MKKSKDKSKDKSKSFKKLKVLAASTLGLSMLLSVPQMPNLLNLVGQIGGANKNQEVVDFSVKDAIKNNSAVTGAKHTTVEGANLGNVAQNTGVSAGRQGGGLADPSKLPTKESVTVSEKVVSWEDSFWTTDAKTGAYRRMNMTELLALEAAQGNIFKKPDAKPGISYTISNALEFAYFSAVVNADYDHVNIVNTTFLLDGDIDLAGKAWRPVYAFNNTARHAVNFDGQGHKILNAYVYDKYELNEATANATDTIDTYYRASIFGSWGDGYIKNLVIENANIQSWRDASIVATKNTSYNLASDFENITIKNSKVVGGGTNGSYYAVGISTNAKAIVDCYMENCEITATYTDKELLGEDRVLNALSANGANHYIYGFGRAMNVYSTSKETGIRNCKIYFEEDFENYNALKNNATRTVYVSGISYWDSDGFTQVYKDIVVDDCDIYSNVNIGDANGAVVFPDGSTTTVPYYHTLNTYVYGGVRFYRNNQNAVVNVENIEIKDSKIYDEFNSKQTNAEYSKDQYFRHWSTVVGAAEVYTSNPVEGTTLYKNIVVRDCDVYANGNIEIIANPTYRRTASNQYMQVNCDGVVAGLANVNTTAATKTSRFENCKVIDTNVTSNNVVKVNDDNNYYATSDTKAVGLALTRGNYTADFYDCVVENCNLEAVSDIDNGAKTEETDYANPTSSSALVMGIGKGSFHASDATDPTKGCKVLNTKMYAESKDTKDPTVDKVGSVGGSAQVVGIGYAEHQDHAVIENALVDNCEMEAKADRVGAYVHGLVTTTSHYVHGFTVKDSEIKNSNLTAYSTASTALVTAGAYNKHHQTVEEATVTVKDCTADNIKIETNSVNGSVYATGLFFSDAPITNGAYFNNNTMNEISFATNREAGYSHFATGFYVSSSTTLKEVHGNTVTNCYMLNDITDAHRVSHGYLAGLGLIRGVRVADDVVSVRDNTVDNLEILNNVNGTDSVSHTIFSAGLIFTDCASVLNAYNNTVKNSTITGDSNVANIYSSGMFLQTTDRKSVIEECYAYNNDVSAVYNRDGSNASRDVYATGLAGWYAAEIKDCVVGSGRVYAHNDISTAGASGVGSTRGFTNGYTARANNELSSVWHARITGCYNFAEVTAETESSSSVTYAAGIGRAEVMLNCANYGNVTGNYAGGITTGYTHGSANQTNTQHSLGLTVRNCMNAGTICRANGGGQSFVGGIVARYEMRYYAEHKLVLENNVSVGGVYSGYDEATDTYSQTLSTGTFIGALYGYISIPTTVAEVNIYDTISIKNNYLLVEDGGKNAGLYYEDNVLDGVEVKGRINAPTINYIATSEGVFYQTSNIETNKTQFTKMYNECMGVPGIANTNKHIASTYNADTFAKEDEVASYYDKTDDGKWYEWAYTTNDVPQLSEITVDRLMVRYDIGEYKGLTPNVDIVEKGDTAYTYTLSDGREDGYGTPSIIDQAGVSLDNWSKGGVNYDPSDEDTSLTNGIVTYHAVVNYTPYTINYVAYEETTVSCVATTVTLNTTTNEITATYAGTNQPTGFEFQVKKADVDEWVTLQLKGVQAGIKTATIDLGAYLDINFFDTYADNTENIYVRAVPSLDILRAFTKTDLNAEGEGHYSITATYGGVDAFTNQAPDGAEVKIEVKADNYYTLRQVTVAGTPIDISNNTASYTIASVNADTEIKVEVEKTQYDLDIQFQNLQGVTLDSSLVSTLITNPTETMAVEESLPQLQAKTNVKGYRFVGWKLQGMDSYLATTDGTINDGYNISTADFARYLAAKGTETKFSIIAVYQRQYQFNVTLNNQFGATFASEYELHYTDENGVDQVLTNVEEGPDGSTSLVESGAYMIDESTFIQLKIKPNKRVDVVEPENEQFGNNVVYVYLTGNKDVAIDFEIRPLTINSSILNVETPTENEGLPANQLVHAVTYTIKDEAGQVVGSSEAGSKLNINDRLSFGCLDDVLATGQFRFVEMRLKNVLTGDYDVVALNDEGQKVVDDEFFNNYVDEVGQVDASMKVIKQYKAEIVGENLVSEDGFTLGSYRVEILDENNALAPASRYTIHEANKSYTLDNGLQLVVKATVENDYAEFAGFTGMFESDTTSGLEAVANISDNRAINLRFEKSTYTIDAPYNATVGGSLEFTKEFKLGDTISISYTPRDNYQITGWTIAGTELEKLGAVQTGNTITIKVTEEFLAAMESAQALDTEKLTLNSDIKTMMNPTMFYGIIGGGAVILVLFGTVVLLVVRSKKLKKQKEENERKLNDIARKFNVADMIKDLKNS